MKNEDFTIPQRLKAGLEQAAKDNGRSLSEEIEARLEATMLLYPPAIPQVDAIRAAFEVKPIGRIS